MNKYISILSFGFLLLLFTGCEKIIDFKGKHPPKKLTVTTMAGCGSDTAFLTLSESYFIYSDETAETPYDTQIKIDVNGIACDNIWIEDEYNSQIVYGFEVDLKEGDVLHVSVESENHPTVTAEERVPAAPVIMGVDTEHFGADGYENLFLRTLIRIKDTPGVSNYYRLFITRYCTINKGTPSEYVTEESGYSIDQDLVMSSLSSQEIQDGDSNLMRVFPDDLFDGKEYSLNVYFVDPAYYYRYEDIEVEVVIELQELSESLYLYMRSLEMSYNSDIFSEPVRIYSNVKGGYGIIGTYNSTKYVFRY